MWLREDVGSVYFLKEARMGSFPAVLSASKQLKYVQTSKVIKKMK
jgi:hypothetical protein